METPTTAAGTGAVVLELGGDVGAAIVRTSDRFDGREVEIRRRGEAWDGRHALVRVRHLGSVEVHAAVFESLGRGGWEARLRQAGGGGGPGHSFEIDGGRVTHLLLNQ